MCADGCGRAVIAIGRIAVVCLVRPKTNVEFWEKKIARNRERDEQNKAKLREMGWSVLTVWECQLRPPVRHATLMEIESFLNRSFLARHGDVKKVRSYSYGEEVVPMAAEPEE